MEEKIIESIRQISSQYDFQCFVIASSDEGIIWREGDFEGLMCTTLESDLFGGPLEVKSLFDYLEGKELMPQLSSQGEVFCVLTKPADDIVIGFFTQDGRDAATLYREGKDLSRDLEELRIFEKS